MERTRHFNATMSQHSRFDRCKTPMGSVPISVIMGFGYPFDSNYTEDTRTDYNRCASLNRIDNQDDRDIRLYNRSKDFGDVNSLYAGSIWPKCLYTSKNRVEDDNYYRTKICRAQTEEANDSMYRRSMERYVNNLDHREHPKQQPCNYPTALANSRSNIASSNNNSYNSFNSCNSYATTADKQRLRRAATVGPQVVSPRHHSSFVSSNRNYWGSSIPSSSSKAYFSSVRSRFL